MRKPGWSRRAPVWDERINEYRFVRVTTRRAAKRCDERYFLGRLCDECGHEHPEGTACFKHARPPRRERE